MFKLKFNLTLTEELKEGMLKNVKEQGYNKGVASILNFNNKYVFLINQKEPFNKEWMFVSGGVEQGESTEDAISREIFEETGLKVINKLKIGEIILENVPNSTIEIFNCSCSGSILLGKNIKAIGIFDKEDLPNNLNEICKKILKMI